MVQVSDNKEFIGLIDFLKNKKGISKKQISKVSGIPYHKINDIGNGKSTANYELLGQLKEAFADQLSKGGQPDLEDKMEALQKEFEQMKKENMEMKNMLLKLQNELLTKKK